MNDNKKVQAMKIFIPVLVIFSFLLLFFFKSNLVFKKSNSSLDKQKSELSVYSNKAKQMNEEIVDTATFGAGCFWCVEAVFQNLKGVKKVMSGYSGGQIKNPSYREVCMGITGHAEVCQILFDSSIINYSELLEVFWKTHDPTTLNRQGNDIGTQYRSVIFFHSNYQKEVAENYKKKLNESKAFDNPIVTEIVPFTVFYPAEDYHQNYYNLNSKEPYCQYVIQPKLDKFNKVFGDKVKK